MNPPKKLISQQQSQEQQQQQAAAHEQTQAQKPLEFASVEEMLRHDAIHTPVPPSIGERLQKSIESEPGAKVPWWRRLFGGTP